MAFCSKCGAQISEGAAFCGGCGAPCTSATTLATALPSVAEYVPLAPVGPGSAQRSTPVTKDESIKLFVGKNYEYFKAKWDDAAEKGKDFTWSWAAFFFGFAWMAYRKMYLYSAIYVGIIAVETMLEFAFDFPDKASMAINLGIAAVFGWQGTAWYKLHVEKTVKEITSMNAPEQARFELVRQGGTNIWVALGFVSALFVVLVLVAVIAEN